MSEPIPTSSDSQRSLEEIDKFFAGLMSTEEADKFFAELRSMPVGGAEPAPEVPEESPLIDSATVDRDIENDSLDWLLKPKRSVFARFVQRLGKVRLASGKSPVEATEASALEATTTSEVTESPEPRSRWSALTDAVRACLPPGYLHLASAFEEFALHPSAQVRESRFYALFEEAASLWCDAHVESACYRMVEAIEMASAGGHVILGNDLYLAVMGVQALILQSSQRPETIVYAVDWMVGNEAVEACPRLHRGHPSLHYSHRRAPDDAIREHELLQRTLAARGVAKVASLVWEENADFASWTCNDLEAGVAALWIGYAREATTVFAVARGFPAEVGHQKLVEADLINHGSALFHSMADALGLRAGDESRTWALGVRDQIASAVGKRRTAAAAETRDQGSKKPDTPATDALGTLESVPVDIAKPASAGAGNGGYHLVCKAPIVPGSERYDVKELERHAVLEKPLPTKKMPAVEELLAAQKGLLLEFPWAKVAIQSAFSELIARSTLGVCDLTLSPMLLVGEPGTGKSRLARRLAEVLVLPHLDVFVAGTSDPKVLSGTSRGWAGGRPSSLATKIARSGCASLLVLVDEVDKAFEYAPDEQRQGGGIGGYLLGMLEPETSCRQYDTFLMTNCDFSHVSWIFTANDLSNLPSALLGRVRVFEIPKPQPEHMAAVARQCLRELELRWRLPAGTLPQLEELGGDWSVFTTPRGVRRGVELRVTKWTQAKAAADAAVRSASASVAGRAPPPDPM